LIVLCPLMSGMSRKIASMSFYLAQKK